MIYFKKEATDRQTDRQTRDRHPIQIDKCLKTFEKQPFLTFKMLTHEGQRKG